MRRTVYKFPLEITDAQFIHTMKEAGTTSQIVHVGMDPKGLPCLWLELTPGTYAEKLEVFIYGTGHPIKGSHNHVGSFVQDIFVWHVYV